jgi:hypothetical protein
MPPVFGFIGRGLVGLYGQGFSGIHLRSCAGYQSTKPSTFYRARRIIQIFYSTTVEKAGEKFWR